jgi:hypothetical protein
MYPSRFKFHLRNNGVDHNELHYCDKMAELRDKEQTLYNTAGCISSDSVQVPPSGPFDFTSLVWVQKEKHVTAKIPKDRLNDYTEGEGHRCNCSFTISRVVNRDKATSQRKDALLFSKVLSCCFGPKDERKFILTNPAEQQPGTRRSKKNMGEGIKVGCQAHFKAAIYAQDPEVIVLNVYEVRHFWQLTVKGPETSRGS